MEKESKEGNFQWVYTVQKIVVYLILFRDERELIFINKSAAVEIGATVSFF